MMGIIDWRMAECRRAGVALRFETWEDAETVLADGPEVVIIATDGLARSDVLRTGGEPVVSGWDILSGDAWPGSDVLVFDDAGDMVGLPAAEKIAATGARVEIVTPDRSFAPEVMGMNPVPAIRLLPAGQVTLTVTWRLVATRREGNALVATLGSHNGPARRKRRVDQIVVNHGTLPLDERYFSSCRCRRTSPRWITPRGLPGGRRPCASIARAVSSSCTRAMRWPHAAPMRRSSTGGGWRGSCNV